MDRFKLVSFDKVKDITAEVYFKNNSLAVDVFNAKYAFVKSDGTKETPAEVFYRVASGLAQYESGEDREYYTNWWFSLMWDGWFRPGGSVLTGVGNPRAVSLINCTSLKVPDDSLEGIIRECEYQMAKCAAMRQGLGADLSSIRPKGSKVNNAAEVSEGVVGWATKFSEIGRFVGQCLTGDVEVLTEHGEFIKIADIVNNKDNIKINTVNGCGAVINWFNNGSKDVCKVTTEYGDVITCSKDHKFKTADVKAGVEVKALKDIKTGDYLVFKRCNVKTDYIKLPEFTYNKSSYNNSNRIFIPSAMPTHFNEDLAYLVGNIFGDGNSYGGYIDIALADDLPEVISKIDVILRNLFGYGIGDYGFSLRDGDGKCKRLKLSKFVYKFLESMGIIKTKAGTLKFPDIVMQSPPSVILAFFAGLFDADGYNSQTKKNIDLTLIDKDFLLDMKKALSKCGVVSKVGLRRTETSDLTTTYKLSLVGKKSAEIIAGCGSIRISRGNLSGKYDLLKTPYTLRDLDIANKAKIPFVSHTHFIPDTRLVELGFTGNDLYVQKVVSIEKIGTEDTYDITVDDVEHMFVANSGFVVSNSGRMPALLLSLKINHPDVEDFIVSKTDLKAIVNANISVQIDEKFINAVKNDEDWELRFEFDDNKYDPIVKVVKAKDLMRLIAKTARDTAEPGLQAIDLMRKGSMVHQIYKATGDTRFRVEASNACSEKPLPPGGTCNLLSPNLEKFSTDPDEYEDELKFIVPFFVRLSDNVVTYELENKKYPLPMQGWLMERVREIGLGMTNLHGWFLKQDLQYDSDEAADKIEQFFSYYAYQTFLASMNLAEEKGNAPAWDMVEDKTKFMESIYFKNIVNEYFDGDVSKVKGLRNMAHMSVAPTGTLSLVFPTPTVSTGVEPIFAPCFWKKTRAIKKGIYTHYFTIPERIKEYVLSKLDPNSEDYKKLFEFPGSLEDNDGVIGNELKTIVERALPEGFFKAAHEIDPLQKIKMMGRLYKWIDAAVSCTYNLPRTSSPDDVLDIYMKAYDAGVRAVSVYVDGSREGILILEDPITYAKKYEAKLNKVCVERPESIIPNCAPRRPKELQCDIHHTSVKGEMFLVMVGIMDDHPFEVFAGPAEDLYLPKSCTKGLIVKEGSGKYGLHVTIRRSPVVYQDLASVLMSDDQKALTRMLSLSLRHGAPPRYIVDQLKKSNGNITAFSTAVSRVLSKYIGTYNLKGNASKCPKCGENSLIFSEGCVKCSDTKCGYSRCG
jgi:ribonucleoside-diphosphate reductase alpha chain